MKKSLLVLGAVLCCFGVGCMRPDGGLQNREDNLVVTNQQHDVIQVQPERKPLWKKSAEGYLDYRRSGFCSVRCT